MTKILIASDHAGFDLKEKLIKKLSEIDWVDLGPENSSRVDYPDFAAKLAKKIQSGEFDQGILICGSGIGMCIAANRFNKVRAALVWNEESAQLSREHNNANVLCMGSRLIDHSLALKIVKTWLGTPFTDQDRHLKRVKKLGEL